MGRQVRCKQCKTLGGRVRYQVEYLIKYKIYFFTKTRQPSSIKGVCQLVNVYISDASGQVHG